MRFSVYLVNEDKRPVEGKWVSVSYMSACRGWIEDAITDGDGHAVFTDRNLEPGEATFTVSDKPYGPYSVRDGDLISIQV